MAAQVEEPLGRVVARLRECGRCSKEIHAFLKQWGGMEETFGKNVAKLRTVRVAEAGSSIDAVVAHVNAVVYRSNAVHTLLELIGSAHTTLGKNLVKHLLPMFQFLAQGTLEKQAEMEQAVARMGKALHAADERVNKRESELQDAQSRYETLKSVILRLQNPEAEEADMTASMKKDWKSRLGSLVQQKPYTPDDLPKLESKKTEYRKAVKVTRRALEKSTVRRDEEKKKISSEVEDLLDVSQKAEIERLEITKIALERLLQFYDMWLDSKSELLDQLEADVQKQTLDALEWRTQDKTMQQELSRLIEADEVEEHCYDVLSARRLSQMGSCIESTSKQTAKSIKSICGLLRELGLCHEQRGAAASSLCRSPFDSNTHAGPPALVASLGAIANGIESVGLQHTALATSIAADVAQLSELHVKTVEEEQRIAGEFKSLSKLVGDAVLQRKTARGDLEKVLEQQKQVQAGLPLAGKTATIDIDKAVEESRTHYEESVANARQVADTVMESMKTLGCALKKTQSVRLEEVQLEWMRLVDMTRSIHERYKKTKELLQSRIDDTFADTSIAAFYTEIGSVRLALVDDPQHDAIASGPSMEKLDISMLEPDASIESDSTAEEETLPLSATETGEIAKHRNFQSKFDLSVDEKLITSFSCAYTKGFPLHGRMYLSRNYIGFHSGLMSSVILMELGTIKAMEKENTAGIFANAIRFRFKDGTDSLFISFINRDDAYTTIYDILKIFRVVQAVENNDEDPFESPSASSPSAVLTSDLDSYEDEDTLEDWGVKSRQERHEGMRCLIDEVLPCTPDKIDELLFSDSFDAMNRFKTIYAKDEVSDMTISPWEPAKGCWVERTCRGKKHLSASKALFGGRIADLQIVEQKIAREACLVVREQSQSAGFMYSDCFHIRTDWDISVLDDASCRFVVGVEFVFTKSTLLKGTIIRTAEHEMTNFFRMLYNELLAELSQGNVGQALPTTEAPTRKLQKLEQKSLWSLFIEAYEDNPASSFMMGALALFCIFLWVAMTYNQASESDDQRNMRLLHEKIDRILDLLQAAANRNVSK